MKRIKYLLPGLCCIALASQAQVIYNNGATVFINTGASVQINGDLVNNTGTFTNNGTVTTTGNFTNNTTIATPVIGMLRFNGSTAQTLGGTLAVAAKDIVVNNAAGVTLTTTLRVDGTATFTDGILNATNSNYPLVFTSNSTVNGTPTNASHVNGYVVKEGTGAFTYPLGNATNYQPVSVNLTANSGGLMARYVPADAGAAPYGTGGTEATQLVQYNPNEYWDLTPAGTATGSVTVYYDSYRPTPISTTTGLRVAHKVGGMWLNEGKAIGVSGTTASGSITSNAVSTWSPFTFGAVSSVILPLSWVSFTGSLTAQKQASLQWQAQEKEVQRYEIEKSSDSRIFTTVGSVGSKGDGRNNYQFTENAVLTGTAYYRIRQTNRNGQATYSAIAKLSSDATEITITAYPNPVKDAVVISVSNQLLGHYLKLSDATGKALQGLTISSNVFTLDMHIYPTGTYLLQWDDGSTRKIIKQ